MKSFVHGGLLVAMLSVAGVAVAKDLRAFTASYEVFIDGKSQGLSEMRLSESSPGQWLHQIESRGTRGMARLSGFAASQSTRFELVDGRPRIASATSRSELLVRTREVQSSFDWDAGVVRWSGDLKPHERAPTPLTPDAVNANILNLMLAIDSRSAAPSSVLRYRLFERGSVDEVDYRIDGRESLTVPAGTFDAVRLRGERPSKRRVITAWYAADLPATPVRLLQVEEGKSSYDLRLSKLTVPGRVQ